MDTIRTPEQIDQDRRRFLGTAAMTVAAAQLAMIGSARAESGKAKSAELPRIKPGTHTSFGPLKQIDAGVLNVGYAEAGPADGPAGHSAARLALRHSQLCRCRAAAGVGGLPGDRPVSARLWHDALSFRRDVPQRPAVGGRARYHRPDGCAQDREGDARRLRLGRADGRHHRGALAGALQGPGLRERLSDRQPGSRQDAAAAEGRAAMVVPVSISPPSAAGPATTSTGTISPSSSGSSPRRNGTSTTPPSIAAPRPSTIRITSPS